VSTNRGRSRVAPRFGGGGSPTRLVVWFFGLAYLISWVWLIPLALSGAVARQGRGWPTHLPALMGPMLAALIVTAVAYGPAGLRDLGRRMIRWRVGWRWWLVAVSPILMLPIAILLGRIAGVSVPTAHDFTLFTGVWSGLGVLGVLVVLIVAGFGEETGWRGFAVPHLERTLSPLRTALVVAPLWALWHLPQFFIVANFRTFTVPMVIGWFFGLICGSIVLTWLYDGSGGSILVVAVWHGLYNLVAGTAAAHGTLGVLVTVLVMIQALVLVVHYRRQQRPHPSAGMGATNPGVPGIA